MPSGILTRPGLERDDAARGAGLSEYAIVLFFVTFLVFGALQAFGTGLGAAYASIIAAFP